MTAPIRRPHFYAAIFAASVDIQIEHACPPHMAIKAQFMPNWGMRALVTVHALTSGTANADWFQIFWFADIDVIGIDNVARMMQFASQRYGKFGGFF
jgi:hypothetical protein